MKWIEYLRLVPEGLKNVDQIIHSLVNEVKMKHGTLPEDQQEEILRRRIICAGCPFMSANADTSIEYKILAGENYTTQREEDHCTFCGCSIKTRTAALDANCGIERWNSDHPDKMMQLKWSKYESEG